MSALISDSLRLNEKNLERTAVVIKNKSYSYGELISLVNKLTNALIVNGAMPGDVIAFYAKNGIELICCYYACFNIGATAVPINNRLAIPEVQYILRNSNAKFFLYQKEFEVALQTIQSQAQFFSTEDLWEEKKATCALTKNFAEDLTAAIFYTSGSTAQPKGVRHSRKTLQQNTAQHIKTVGYHEEEKNLVCLSLAISFPACHQMFTTLSSGGTLFVMEQFDPKAAIQCLLEHKITMLYAPPVVYQRLLQYIDMEKIHETFSLRLAIIAGDTAPLSLYKKFATYFKINLSAGIGMTETLFYALNFSDNKNKCGSMGLPVEGVSLKIVDENFRALPVKQIGEIAIQTSNIMQGYLNNVEETNKALKEGWLLGGDLGYLDEEGFLWFVGRKKHIIVRGGAKIPPAEVENVLQQHQDILEAVVVGTADPTWGEVGVAFAALKPSAEMNKQKILSYLKSHLADYKVPAEIIFLDHLPKGSTNKVDRLLLKQHIDKARLLSKNENKIIAFNELISSAGSA